MDNIVDNADESSAPTLPEELILEILEYLEVQDLETHLLIKEHRNLIQESSKLRRKLPKTLELSNNWKEKMPFIKNNGLLITEISFKNCRFDALTDFGIILTMCKYVEIVRLENCYIIDEKLDSEVWDFGPLKLINLKSLWLDDKGIVKGILNYFENVDYLESLTLTFHEERLPSATSWTSDSLERRIATYPNPNVMNVDILKTFLLQQKKLKHLELYGYNKSFESFFKTNIAEQVHFQLDGLIFHFDIMLPTIPIIRIPGISNFLIRFGHYTNNENCNDNIIAFLRTQKSIKEINTAYYNISSIPVHVHKYFVNTDLYYPQRVHSADVKEMSPSLLEQVEAMKYGRMDGWTDKKIRTIAIFQELKIR